IYLASALYSPRFCLYRVFAMNSPAAVSPDRLRQFTSFRTLSEEDLLVLSGRVAVKEARRGDTLFKCGDIDSTEIFLLGGKLQLIAEDGRERVVEADSEASKMPIARLRPRQYTAKALTTVDYISVDVDLLESLAERQRSADEMDVGYGFEEISYQTDETDEMLQAFKRDLDARKFRLTSLPEVAQSIRNLLNNDNAGA